MATKKSDDSGQSEVQKIVNEQNEKGHIGTTRKAFPNEAFSLKTGPDSPSALEQQIKALENQAEDLRGSNR